MIVHYILHTTFYMVYICGHDPIENDLFKSPTKREVEVVVCTSTKGGGYIRERKRKRKQLKSFSSLVSLI